MKTYKTLWPLICTFENLYLAWRKAKRGKSTKRQVVKFETDLEENLLLVLEELLTGSYTPGEYKSFYVYEGKRRKISAAPFRDRVVHHALCNVIEPVFERHFIHDSYACRWAKGSHSALDRCTHFARRYPYVLQCDVDKFFASVDHAILLGMIGRYIRDERVMDLAGKILASGEGILDEEVPPRWFAGDDLFGPLRPKGLPIGNLTSQFWANVYLNGLDHYVKRELKVQGYVRYADDFLLFGPTKPGLWALRDKVVEFLATIRLLPNPKRFHVFPVRQGIDFLGFRVYPDHRRVLARNVRKARQRLRLLARLYADGRVPLDRVSASVRGWIAHVAHGDTWGLRQAVLRDITFRVGEARRHG